MSFLTNRRLGPNFVIILFINYFACAQITKDRDTISHQIFKDGNEYFHVNIPSIPLNYYVYKFKMSEKNKLNAVFANNTIPDFKRLTVPKVANNQHTNKTIAAINGDFFSYKSGELEGFQVSDGIVTYGYIDKVKYGINIDFKNHIQLDSVYFTGSLKTKKEIYPIKGVNTLKYKDSTNSIILFNSFVNLDSVIHNHHSFVLLEKNDETFHFVKEIVKLPKALKKNHYLLAINTPTTRAIVTQLKKEQTFTINTILKRKKDDKPLQLSAHISGGIPLVYNNTKVTSNSEISNSYRGKKHPRTAVGVNKKENIAVWIVADGRSDSSSGLNYNDLAELFIENNCENAINLDGGGSSVLWLNGKIKNIPSDKKGTRPCLNYLLLSH